MTNCLAIGLSRKQYVQVVSFDDEPCSPGDTFQYSLVLYKMLHFPDFLEFHYRPSLLSSKLPSNDSANSSQVITSYDHITLKNIHCFQGYTIAVYVLSIN